MKKVKNILVILAFLTVPVVTTFGQSPPSPPSCPPAGGGGSNLLVGSSAPVGGPIEDGIQYVLGLTILYGAFKLRKAKKIAVDEQAIGNRQ